MKQKNAYNELMVSPEHKRQNVKLASEADTYILYSTTLQCSIPTCLSISTYNVTL